MRILQVLLALGFASASAKLIETEINNCVGVMIGGTEMTPFTCFNTDPIDLSGFFDNFDATVSDLEDDFDEIDTDDDGVLSIDELASFFGMVKSGSSGSGGMAATALPTLVASIAAIAF